MITPHTTVRDAVVGDTFSSGPRTSGFAEWNRFAAVNDEFVPIHMDDEEGRAAGFPGAIGMGRLQWSWVHDLLRSWLADEGRIVEVELQFRATHLKDSVVDCRGRVRAVRHTVGERLLDCDLWTEDGTGRVLAPGAATVAVAVAVGQR